MSKLEDALRKAAARGELTHLSLSPVQVGRGKGAKIAWAARYRGASEGKYAVANNDDPVGALVAVLTGKGAKAAPNWGPGARGSAPAEDSDFG